MALKVCISGATGWVGRELVAAVNEAEDMTLVAAVARSAAGKDIGEALGGSALGVTTAATIGEALEAKPDVVIDYTKPDVVKEIVNACIWAGSAVVVGTSGLTADDYAEIDALATDEGVGVIASGNFSLTATLLQHFALTAAQYLPSWEIIDYAGAHKPDAPSGTGRELGERLSEVGRPNGRPESGWPVEETMGSREARGGTIDATQVHSVRLPGFALSVDAIFGQAVERLTIRHDAGTSAEIYVGGSLLAARHAPEVRGLVRGLDNLLFD
jgi:4-hydroxy-tetrahydrodipicolinate reductase